MPGSKGVALVVAPTKAADELIHGWAEARGQTLLGPLCQAVSSHMPQLDFGTTDSVHVAEASTSFGLLIFGLDQDVSFGTAAAQVVE